MNSQSNGRLTPILTLTLAAVLPAFTPANAQLPRVEALEAQPLQSQIQRLQEALQYLGAPLPQAARDTLERAQASTDNARAARLVQDALDPLCAAAVTIGRDGSMAAHAGARAVELQEQGWRTHLVKVLNQAEAPASLRVSSPNAGPLPEASTDQVALRWLDLQLYNSRPLKPRLGGLPLEYRIIQLYSSEPGPRQARLDFSVDGIGRESNVIKQWDFDNGMDNWFVQRHMDVKAIDGAVVGRSTGNDPSIAALVRAPGGRMKARFSAKAGAGSMGQFFWWTRENPRADGQRRVNFLMSRNGGQWKEYEVGFHVEGELMGIRIDLGSKPTDVELDWVQVSRAEATAGAAASVSVPVNAVESRKVTLRVRDENAKPCTAAFVVEDANGRIYPAQAKRLAPDFFFHSQIYRADGEQLRLPDGDYTIRCSRGPESIPETRRLTVDGSDTEFAYRVKRWIDPSKRGWFSGDHHIHAAGCRHYTNPTEGVLAEDMARHIQGEDLKIGANLTWGPGFDYQKQFFTGKLDKASRYPYLLRYDVEVSGFGSHRSGHLCLLRLSEQIYPGGDSKDHWPTLGLNTLKWAKQQGAITGPAHSAIGLAPTARRVPGVDGPDNLPNYFIPRHDGIGANEYIVDITHNVPGPEGTLVPAVDFISTMDTDRTDEFNMWYHTLNCGFRVRASGETDFPCISGDRVGKGRVYAKVDGRLDYDQWCEEIRNGRSYISDGFSHLMDFRATGETSSVAVGEKGSELRLKRPGKIKLAAVAAARFDDDRRNAAVELIVNGFPRGKRNIPSSGEETKLSFNVEIDRSSWVALRVFPSSHTNPIFVIVGDEPIQSRHSARWFLESVDQLWSQKQAAYDADEQEDARQAYAHAKRVYQRLVREAKYD